jgi:Fe-S cluster biogenesis protein NfuA
MTQSSEQDAADLQARMRQLDGLLQEVERVPDPAERARTAQVIRSLMDFHGAGLAAVVARLSAAGDAGRAILDDLAANDLVASLLLLYDLHPLDLEARVRLALDKVRPYLASHGGSVTLLGVTPDGVVRLRMEGSCHGCPSSAATLKTTIEQAILEKAPDAASIEVEGATAATAPPSGFVPVEQLVRNGGTRRTSQGALNHA